MSLKRLVRRVGKFAAKTAPIWMSFVPGVGTAAGLAIRGAALGVAKRKAGGGGGVVSLLGSKAKGGGGGGLLGKFETGLNIATTVAGLAQALRRPKTSLPAPVETFIGTQLVPQMIPGVSAARGIAQGIRALPQMPGTGGFSTGRGFGGGADVVPLRGGPRGYRLTARGFVKIRRMNAGNAKALRRALRRVEAFGKLTQRTKKAAGRAARACGAMPRGYSKRKGK